MFLQFLQKFKKKQLQKKTITLTSHHGQNDLRVARPRFPFPFDFF